jgi:hypothetical protein
VPRFAAGIPRSDAPSNALCGINPSAPDEDTYGGIPRASYVPNSIFPDPSLRISNVRPFRATKVRARVARTRDHRTANADHLEPFRTKSTVTTRSLSMPGILPLARAALSAQVAQRRVEQERPLAADSRRCRFANGMRIVGSRRGEIGAPANPDSLRDGDVSNERRHYARPVDRTRPRVPRATSHLPHRHACSETDARAVP